MKTVPQLRADAEQIWTAALKAVEPEAAVRKHVRRRGNMLRVGGHTYDLDQIDRIWVLGAGKAAAPMGIALEKTLGRRLKGGILVTKYGHGLPMNKVELLEAGHPLPDSNGLRAGERIRELAQSEIRAQDLVFCLLSGGGSALLVSPAPGVTLEDKLACTRLLLRSGATIHETNTIRKHLSSLKGGGLARHLPRVRAVSLILSDVVGDDLDTIASGPMVPDRSTFRDCLDIIHRFGLRDRIPAPVRRRFEEGAGGRLPDTPKPADPVFRNKQSLIVASNSIACTAAYRQARRLGYKALVLTSRTEGDTAECARLHLQIAQEIISDGRPLGRPACILSGGETTVHVRGQGEGGRNQEFALQAAKTLSRLEAPCLVVSLGTDGTDGPTDAAGACSDNTTLARSLRFGGRFLQDAIENNDSYNFFKRLGDLIITGPTRTNVMDLHIVLVG